MFNSKKIVGENYKGFFLEWDSNYFGIKSAKVILNGPVDKKNQDSIINFCNEYDFVTITNNNNNKVNNYWLGTRTKSFLTDMNVQFTKLIADKPEIQTDKVYITNNLSENNQIIRIASKTFHNSRFFNDPNLPETQANEVYLNWTKNSFERKDKYFVICERKNDIAGYIIFSIIENTCVIELLAVYEKYQGSGVGKSLMQAIETYIIENQLTKTEVGTQLNNLAAVHFYNKTGFKFKSCNAVYHLWK